MTETQSGQQRLVKGEDAARDPLKDLLLKHLHSGKSGMEETPDGKVFLTVYVPPPRLVITGAVHISQALAPMARMLNYDVTIVDPRTAFASPERFPGMNVIAQWPDEALPPLGIDRYTAFAALTHDPKIDDPALTHALTRDCFYIGALGSKKTHGRRVEAPESAGRHRRADRAHPCTDRPFDRRGLAVGDRGVHHGADHGVASPAGHRVMKFGAVPVAQALGATAVHSIRQKGFVLKKGTVIGPTEIDALKAAGISEVVVARMDAGDIGEDEAAACIAAALGGEGVDTDRAFTGRCNLFAASAGVLVVERPAIDALNRIDEAITFATLPAFKPVVAGEMIGTVKIIPFAVPEKSVSAALAIAETAKPLVRVAPYRVKKVGIVSTLLPGLSEKVIDKTLKSHAGASCARRREDRCGAARRA